MVTKNRRKGSGLRNKFEMTGGKLGMTRLKFGVILLIALCFTSCSFYTDLRENPVFKAGAVSYPKNISAIYGNQSTGCITLVWKLVENASAYEIYRVNLSGSTKISKNYINSNATLIYEYSIPYTQEKNTALEISNISSGRTLFFIKSVSENGSKSDFSKKYISFYSQYMYNKNLTFRELKDFEFEYTVQD